MPDNSHWTLRKGALTIFGESGVAAGDTIYYIENGALQATEIDGSAHFWLQETVRMAGATGREIVYLGVAPRMALMLVLEGTLSRQTLDKAPQESDRILYGKVEVNGRLFQLVMMERVDIAVAAFDAAGKII